MSECSDLDDKVLCNRIILAQGPLFQAILSEFWRKSPGVCENYFTSLRRHSKSGNEISITSHTPSRHPILKILGLFVKEKAQESLTRKTFQAPYIYRPHSRSPN
jgi:hypothetical protein